MFNKLKSYKSLLTMAAISAMANFAKAETKESEFVPGGNISDIQLVNGSLMVKSEGAKIAEKETPYVFMPTNRLDAGFSMSYTNAQDKITSVAADENGNGFATTSNGKVWKFKVGENGIPSVTDEFTPMLGDKKINDLKLFAVKGDKVYGYYQDMIGQFSIDGNTLAQNECCLAGGYVDKVFYDGTDYVSTLAKNGEVKKVNLLTMDVKSNHSNDRSDITAFAEYDGDFMYGYSDGRLSCNKKLKFNGPVSSLSKLSDGIYATSTSTNKIFGITEDTQGEIEIQNAKGIKKVLDNPKQKNTLYFVTTNSVGRTAR